jgi:hypothetical protein
MNDITDVRRKRWIAIDRKDDFVADVPAEEQAPIVPPAAIEEEKPGPGPKKAPPVPKKRSKKGL